MTEVLGRNQPRRKIAWFDLGARVSFLVIGLLLLARVLWHLIEHHELLPKTLLSGVIFCSVAVMFAVQGLKSKRPSRQRLRGKISKRNRRIRLFLLLCVLSSSSYGQIGYPDEAHSGTRGGTNKLVVLAEFSSHPISLAAVYGFGNRLRERIRNCINQWCRPRALRTGQSGANYLENGCSLSRADCV